MRILIFLVVMLSQSCGKVQSTNNRAAASEEKEVEEKVKEQEPEINFSLDDIGFYMADDLRGLVDNKFASFNSDDLAEALKVDLNDQGLTAKLYPVFVAWLDADKNNSVNFAEFSTGTIEAGENKTIIEKAVEGTKKLLFDTMDENANGSLEEEEFVNLIKVRIWILKNWTDPVPDASPDRLKLLVKNGFKDFQSFLLKELGANVEKQAEAISKKFIKE